ncbi:hypothetical protein YTPLAS18_09350 [Nitrospira sp.]|nr:hypothetical protein YTPLAS18_09350 [Nitrospira sp.]
MAPPLPGTTPAILFKRHMRMQHWVLVVLMFAVAGCASLSGSREQYVVCPYDTAWESTVEAMKGYSITSQDKISGRIETAWLEVPAADRSFGVFSREGFGNYERARMTVAVRQLGDTSSISVLENRQRWHARGGVSQQATKWWPIDPSEEATAEALGRIKTKLRDHGCSVT